MISWASIFSAVLIKNRETLSIVYRLLQRKTKLVPGAIPQTLYIGTIKNIGLLRIMKTIGAWNKLIELYSLILSVSRLVGYDNARGFSSSFWLQVQ